MATLLAINAVRDATDDSLRGLMELHREIGWRCDALGHARFEEGSEHFFAYCFEHVTGSTILHGELVTVGALIMASLDNGMSLLNVENYTQYIVKGAVLVAAVGFDMLGRRKS